MHISHFNSEEKQEAMSKELDTLRLQNVRKPGRTETQALDSYLDRYDNLLAMELYAHSHPDTTVRLLETGCKPTPWMKFALNKLTRPFRTHAMRTAFYNAIVITREENSTIESSVPALFTDDSTIDPMETGAPSEVIMYCPNGDQIMFIGQRRYGRNSNYINQHHRDITHHRSQLQFRNRQTRVSALCFNSERGNCTVKRWSNRKDFERNHRNHYRWLQQKRLLSLVRMCSLSQLVEADRKTKEVNGICFVERDIETFINHGPDAAEGIFTTSSTNTSHTPGPYTNLQPPLSTILLHSEYKATPSYGSSFTDHTKFHTPSTTSFAAAFRQLPP